MQGKSFGCAGWLKQHGQVANVCGREGVRSGVDSGGCPADGDIDGHAHVVENAGRADRTRAVPPFGSARSGPQVPVQDHGRTRAQHIHRGVPDQVTTACRCRRVVRVVELEVVQPQHPLVEGEPHSWQAHFKISREGGLSRAVEAGEQVHFRQRSHNPQDATATSMPTARRAVVHSRRCSRRDPFCKQPCRTADGVAQNVLHCRCS